MKDMMIGVDLAKNVFQVHGAFRTGEVQFRRKLTRTQFSVFMAQQERCLVIFEACGSAHYWAHEMELLGHEVKLIAPQYARPFVKRQKNDAADAKAIVIAARQPEMRFVAPKTVEQQSRAAVFRGRERLVHQRTADVNALRALLIIGAMSRLNWLGQRTITDGSWLSRMLARKPRMLVAIALANKMARQIWAMLTKNEDYRDPALAGVA